MRANPSPASPLSNWVKLKIWVTYRDGGWVETYDTLTTSFTQCQSIWSNLLGWRSFLLPQGYTLVQGTMSMAGTTGDSYPMYIPSQRTVGSQVNEDGGTFNVANAGCNDDNACLLFRLDTGQGIYSNHWLRGIRDYWIADDKLTLTMPLDYAATVAPGPDQYSSPLTQVFPYGGSDGLYNVNGSTYSETSYSPTFNAGRGYSVGWINAWLSILRDFTALYRPIPNATTFNQYLYGANGGNWYYLRVSERTAGKRYAFSRAKKPNFA